MDDYNKEPSQSYGASTGSAPTGTAARMKEQISEKAADVKDKVTDLSRRTADKVDEGRESAAGALDKTASSLHAGGDQLSGVAHSVADKMQATADYVRRTDVRGMAEDIQDLMRRYPGQSLAAAAILGFLVARGMSRND
jgi:ElaB/YqjD/DUF883 family membrane-anchored ribosome-binding protein